ncbi:MFS transporter [Oceanobacillus kimchii]|uniref:MFS transporter n=1 Tax=Oceanobacillus kimchii TaxID=746691 RepID=A0ABQ5THD2_9BACI|nr:MFS transporter [Oceanobacillus kimchii]GLO64525.1 MFS transporter [Oceanobacillus kimchii]
MFNWKYPLLLLSGIGISNIGGWVYLIALNLIILNETGSPFAVAILYILIPLATICSNFWSGSMIDRVNTRKLMISLDLFRGVCIALIPLIPSLPLVYVVAFIINMATSIFEPASMVYMTKLIPKKDRQRFNALRSFINSCGAMIGPVIAGGLFWLGTPPTAIYVNALAMFCSAVIIFFLPNVTTYKAKNQDFNFNIIRMDIKVVLDYSKKHLLVAKIYLFFCGTTIFMAAIDSLEASFAKGVLLISDTSYGFLLSLFGVGIIAGSIMNTICASRFKINYLIAFGTIFTALGYVVFYSSQGFVTAVFGVVIIGFSVTFANTGYLTFYQNHVPVTIMGRFGSVFNIIEAIFIIGLTILVGFFADIIAIRSIGLVSSICFFVLGIMVMVSVSKSNRNNFFNM